MLSLLCSPFPGQPIGRVLTSRCARLLVALCLVVLGVGPVVVPTGYAQETADGPATAEFKEGFQKWKDLLTELRDIQGKYQVAEDNELDGLREQWSARLAAGQQMIVDLRTKAIAAFKEAPNADREINEFLIKLLADDLESDRFESAWELSQVLLAGKCDEKWLNELAAIAAFVNNEYDQAEQLFAKAPEIRATSQQDKQLQALTDNFRHYRELVPEYKAFWAEEKKLREAEAAADDLPRVQFTTTEGDIVIELFENEAPETVGNFVSLVKKGFYNGLTFHRVLPHFMAQGGCPDGNGSGGPGYTIYCECKKPEYRKHFRGSLSMAKTARPNTGGSQFFLTFVPTSHLNGEHTVFGRVYSGMDVLEKLRRRDPDNPVGDPSKIVEAKVLRDRGHEYVPHKVQ
jgi:cyclophilin family peptidyl-prolyl cis-trans isomerase